MKKIILQIIFFLAFIYLAESNNITEFSGRILDASDNSPIFKAKIEIRRIGLSVLTDKNGHFHFINLPKDTFTVFFSAKGYIKEKRLINLANQELRNIRLRLFPKVYNMPSIVVTDKIYGNKFDEIHEFTGSVANNDLVKDLGNTIASTLSNEVGISMRSMGPAPARPVIRGLDGPRIAMAEDGLNIVDLSSTSPDHAVTVDPSTVDRIEILRGPKTLLNTSTTIGGVVNIIRNDIPLKLPAKPEASLLLYGETVNKGYNGAGKFNIPIGKFCINTNGSYRKTGNLYSPLGVIDNTEIKNYNYSVGAGYIENDYSIGVGMNEFSSIYGIPGGFVGSHPHGVNISMFKKLMQAKGLFHIKDKIFDVVEIDFGRTYYNHKEYESNGSIGAEYIFKNYSGRINVNHKQGKTFREGSFGMSINNQAMELGGYVFTPPTNSINFAAFGYESIQLGNHSIELGLRYSYAGITPNKEDSTKIGLIRQRIFNTISASASIMHKINDNIYAGINLSRSTRAPSAAELFSLGPHLAAYSYEVGNPNLREESGYGSEIFTFLKYDGFTTSLTGFFNYMDYYIISRNTGKINIQQLLPIYASTGVPAKMYGFEFSFHLDLSNKFSIKANSSYTSASNADNNQPLPFIPPFKGNLELNYKPIQGLVISAGTDFAAAQNRTGEFEEPTDGYVIFNSSVFYSFQTGSVLHSITLSFDNIFNQIYRNHLSRIKSVFPEPGRNFKLTYKMNV